MSTIKQYYSFAATLILLVIMTGCNPKSSTPIETNDLPMNYITSFQLDKPDHIELEYFTKMSDQRDSIAPAKKIQITDADKINELMILASELPDKGDIMIKMGDVPIVNVILYYPDKKLYFTYYDSRIKTPDTSFYSHAPEAEKTLHDLLFSVLN